MSLSKPEIEQIVKQYGKESNDTGSPEVQIALFTTRIEKLTSHFKEHKQDIHSRRGLLRIVNARRSKLNYLKKNHPERYRDIVTKLKIRG
jgi:small subunit ribosomal protein S15